MLDILAVIDSWDSSIEIELPPVPVSYIHLTECNEEATLDTEEHLQSKCSQPFSDTDVFRYQIAHHSILAKGTDIKTVYDITLETDSVINHCYLPGDTIGILTKNPAEEVNQVLMHLGLESDSDKVYSVQIDSSTKKKAAKIPPYIPEHISIRKLFTECLDLRAIPKKLFVRALVKYTSDSNEKRFLEILCNKQGNAFNDVILKKDIRFLALLQSLPHCVPPVALLIEHLPRLMPRPYSIANFRLQPEMNSNIRIIFSVKETSPGLTTTMLQNHCQTGKPVSLYFRKSTYFAYTDEDLEKDVILIGVGTGIAPYLGFLEKRRIYKQGSKTSLGKAHLYAGFRYEGQSYIGRQELERYLNDKLLDGLHVAFSRDPYSENRHVQDLLENNKIEIFKSLSDTNTKIYVCGDGKTMLPQIARKISKIYAHFMELDDEEAERCILQLKNDRYIEDLWL